VNNIMFPSAGGSQFTTDQRTILRASALYRGIVSSGGSPGNPLSIGAPPDPPSEIELPPMMAVTRMRKPQDDAEELLSGIWCAHGGADYEAIVDRLVPRARLLELARDDNAFDLVRARALRVLSRFGADVEVVALARDMAASKTTGRITKRAANAVLAPKR
jgi:hypothetical protein